MEIKTPDLGVDSAEVSEIYVNIGDVIAVDDNIVLLESDKASVEVPSTIAGKVKSIMVSVGDTVSEGVVLLDVESEDTESEGTESEQAQEITQNATQTQDSTQNPVSADTSGQQNSDEHGDAQSVQRAGESVTHALPDLGVDEAQVAEIMVNVGDTVSAEQPLILVESDKASVEVPAPTNGVIEKILVSACDTVKNGQDFIVLSSSSAQSSSQQPSLAPTADERPKNTSDNQPTDTNDQTQKTAVPETNTQPAEQTHALPDLGVEEAQVAEIMVNVGDEVTAEQSILLVESDKASVEVPAPVSGKVIKLLVNAGDTVSNGQDFIVIASQSSQSSASSSQSTNANKPSQQTEQGKPSVQQEQQQGQQGQQQGQPAKAQTSVAQTSPQVNTAKLTESQVNAKATDVYAGPAVRKLARQLGVDITQVKGSAVNNRIIKEDLFAFVKSAMQNTGNMTSNAQANVTTTPAVSLPKLPDMSKVELWGEIERQPLSRLQKVSIPQLNHNNHIPQVTQFDLADITDTESFRGELKADFKKQGIGLTILAFIVKATTYALQQYPKFNSHLSDDNTELLVRKSINMGIAVATEDGLVVPVIKNAQDKGIKELAVEIGELAGKARDKKLTPKDITGASFTISSQGNLGGTAFTPLVTWPQVAILGVSEASMQPRWNASKQNFEPRLMLPLSLSYDHRVINGADAAVFTRYVAQLLADPRKILL
ncbi:2-oxo acid dehydrogenase subunit E2 [Moraxella lincolnii]|uniref:2-oxo acid dehydrogenase subunit E2 n=1 Tax=Lwoffella lincolnii TaxID=90241 RepID=UPI0039844A66